MVPPLHSDSKCNILQWPIRPYVLFVQQPRLLTSLSHLPTSIPLVHFILATVAPLLLLKHLGSSLSWVFALAIPSAWNSLLQDSHIAAFFTSFKFLHKYLTILRLTLITLFKFVKCQSPILSPPLIILAYFL